jgi:hypothetical protein
MGVALSLDPVLNGSRLTRFNLKIPPPLANQTCRSQRIEPMSQLALVHWLIIAAFRLEGAGQPIT